MLLQLYWKFLEFLFLAAFVRMRPCERCLAKRTFDYLSRRVASDAKPETGLLSA